MTTSELTSTEAESVIRVFGADPWMRFDLWATRAWEASQNAIAVAASVGTPISSNDDLDHRIITSFHAAGIAKEFAAMVNPVPAVCGGKGDAGVGAVDPSDLTLAMIIGTEDSG